MTNTTWMTCIIPIPHKIFYMYHLVSSSQTHEAGITTVTLQTRTLRSKEIKKCSHGHKSSKFLNTNSELLFQNLNVYYHIIINWKVTMTKTRKIKSIKIVNICYIVWSGKYNHTCENEIHCPYPGFQIPSSHKR